MRRNRDRYDAWDEAEDVSYGDPRYPDARYPSAYQESSHDQAGYNQTGYGQAGYDEDGYDQDDEQHALMPYDDRGAERGLQAAEPIPLPSLVGVSATVTNYGSPLLSYSRTMTRFYQARKQVLSLGRHKCAICSDRITGWAWLAPNGGHAHDGCYDRLAWAWATVYAEQQHMAACGELE